MIFSCRTHFRLDRFKFDLMDTLFLDLSMSRRMSYAKVCFCSGMSSIKDAWFTLLLVHVDGYWEEIPTDVIVLTVYPCSGQ